MSLSKRDVTPDFKTSRERPAGAVKKQARHTASPKRKAEIRERKCQSCRVCGVTAEQTHIHMHHIVRRGAPWFGTWTENNILGLCGDCHHELHAQNTLRIRKILRVRLTLAEVRYADEKAYEGWVDDHLWRVRPAVTSKDAA